MEQRWVRILELGLRSAAAVALLLAGLWVLGPNGTSTVEVPDTGTLRPLYGSSLLDWGRYPFIDVRASGANEASAALAEATASLQPDVGFIDVGEGGADLYPALEIGVYDAAAGPGLAYLALHVLTLVGLAWVLWSLARLVRSSREDSPFTAHNAALLTRIGVVVAVGGLARSVAEHLVDRWIVETTTRTKDLVDTFPYDVGDVPYGYLLVGVSVVILARVWRRGVAMTDDLVGLV